MSPIPHSASSSVPVPQPGYSCGGECRKCGHVMQLNRELADRVRELETAPVTSNKEEEHRALENCLRMQVTSLEKHLEEQRIYMMGKPDNSWQLSEANAKIEELHNILQESTHKLSIQAQEKDDLLARVTLFEKQLACNKRSHSLSPRDGASPRHSRVAKSQRSTDAERNEENLRVLQLELADSARQIQQLLKENKMLRESTDSLDDVEGTPIGFHCREKIDATTDKVTAAESSQSTELNEERRITELNELKKELKHLQVYNEKITADRFQLRTEKAQQEEDIERLEAVVTGKLPADHPLVISPMTKQVREMKEKWENAEKRIAKMEERHETEIEDVRKSLGENSDQGLTDEVARLKEEKATLEQKHATEVEELKLQATQADDMRELFQIELEKLDNAQKNKTDMKKKTTPSAKNGKQGLDSELEELKKQHAEELAEREKEMREAFTKELRAATEASKWSRSESPRSSKRDEDTIAEYKREVAEMEKEVERLTRKLMQSRRRSSSTSSARLARLKEKSEDIRRAFQREVDETLASAGGGDPDSRHLRKMEQMRLNHELEVEDLKRDAERRVRTLQYELEDAKSGLYSSKDADLAEQLKNYKAELEEMRSLNRRLEASGGGSREMEKMRLNYEDEVESIKHEADLMKRALRKELDAAKSGREVEEVREQHEREIAELQRSFRQELEAKDGSIREMEEMRANYEDEIETMKRIAARELRDALEAAKDEKQMEKLRRDHVREMEELRREAERVQSQLKEEKADEVEKLAEKIDELRANYEGEIDELKRDAEFSQEELHLAKQSAGDSSELMKQMGEIRDQHDEQVARLKDEMRNMSAIFQKKLNDAGLESDPALEVHWIRETVVPVEDVHGAAAPQKPPLELQAKETDDRKEQRREEVEYMKKERGQGTHSDCESVDLEEMKQKLRAVQATSYQFQEEVKHWKEAFEEQKQELARQRTHTQDIIYQAAFNELHTESERNTKEMHEEKNRQEQLLQQVICQLRSAYESKDDDCKKLFESATELENLCMSQKEEIRTLTLLGDRELEELQHELTVQAQKERAELIKNNDKLQDQVVYLQAEVRKIEGLKHTLDEREDEVKAATNRYLQASKEIERLRRQLSVEKAEQKRAELDRNELVDAGQMNKLENRNRELEAKIADGDRQLVEKEEEVEALLAKSSMAEDTHAKTLVRMEFEIKKLNKALSSSGNYNSRRLAPENPDGRYVTPFRYPKAETTVSQVAKDTERKQVDIVEQLLDNWGSNRHEKLLKRVFEDCASNNSLRWEHGEAKTFLRKIFTEQQMAEPEFPQFVLQRIYHEVKKDFQTTKVGALNFEEACEFAKRMCTCLINPDASALECCRKTPLRTRRDETAE